MPLRELLGTGLFDVTKAEQAPGWVVELNGGHVPETEEYGISSMVFRSERPFHPERLWRLISEDLDSGAFGTVLRSKGFFQLSTRPGVTGLWSQAGSVAHFEPAGHADPAEGHAQELVFIGTELRPDTLHDALTACLADWSETGKSETGEPDPFPAWDLHVHAA